MEHGAGSKMNTLAVNRLLRQLEAAIAGGQHTRAATLARQLARHKVNCCVTRHRGGHVDNDTFTVDVFVEDRLSHQGPYPVQVSPDMTVAQLKAKVEAEFEIPAAVQRWILGKQLATDDRATLQHHSVTQHCPVFLYLVAPEAVKTAVGGVEGENEAAAISAVTPPDQVAPGGTAGEKPTPLPPGGRGWYYNEEDDRYSLCESEVTDHSSKDGSPEHRDELTGIASDATAVEAEEDVDVDHQAGDIRNRAVAVDTGTLTIGWKCPVCTLINPPTRPGCSACGTDRPADHEADGAEQQRRRSDQTVQQVAADDAKLKNYQALMVLENADLIASTEAFECSVCLTECAAGDGVVLRDCLHSFCRVCLAHTVQFTEEAEVKCPFRDHEYSCDSTLQEREIKAAQAAAEEEDDSCIICMAEPRSCALTPCGHRAYCETCCLRLIELDHMCSLCRRKADGYLLIYL